MDVRGYSLIVTIVIALSAFINFFLGYIMPRSQIMDSFQEVTLQISILKSELPLLARKSEVYSEINRIELNMMELDIIRREERKCELISSDLEAYLVCLEEVNYRASLRYFDLNK